MDVVADAFNMANTLSTVSFCFAILASIADFPPDIGLPKASSISLGRQLVKKGIQVKAPSV